MAEINTDVVTVEGLRWCILSMYRGKKLWLRANNEASSEETWRSDEKCPNITNMIDT